MADHVAIRRALISVWDKTGLLPFAQRLASFGVEIVSTGGTAAALSSAGLKITTIDSLTGFPEMLSGRVKTLHPMVHGGLLGVRDDSEHAAQMERHGIRPIDLLCVNLYPFEQTIARENCTKDEAIENIDIGGPAMIRSAAKNHEWVTVVTSPSQYDRVGRELELNRGLTSLSLRTELAAAAFALTCRYDGAIAAYLSPCASSVFPPVMNIGLVKADELRYGENPHQRAALYRTLGHDRGPAGTIANAQQLHGKELSYNNILDANAAMELAWALERACPGRVGACIVKHTNPCGAAVSETAADAVTEAIASDPLAAYGGILALNDELDLPTAERLLDKGVFLEVAVAPSFDADAVGVLQGKSVNLRLLACGALGQAEHATHDVRQIEFRSIPGGVLAQERDVRLAAIGELTHSAGPPPDPDLLRAARLLEAVGRSLLSNAVVIGGVSRERQGSIRQFGAGAGQMDRLTACRIAVEKAGKNAHGSAAFSDAFFPFPDGARVLIDAGVKLIMHPGGSKRDQDTLDLCNDRGVTCITTGVRHFRH